jgi:hypothetical protein
VPDEDGDEDGALDCIDECPTDPAKTEPGDCGCGMSDAPGDGDGDGTPDCTDGCPTDMNKTAAGMCGCNMTDADGDQDGTADCVDMCPADPAKTAPGGCGCGIPDADSGGVVGCLGLKNALVRRYRFAGSGSSIADAMGGAAGTLTGGTQTGGNVVLDADNEYVTLPDGIFMNLTNATIEMWVTWTGNSGGAWQRLFDFGSSTSGSGTSYLFLTPRGPAPDDAVMLLVFRGTGGSELRVRGMNSLPASTQLHVAVVVDDTNNQLAFYVNSALEGMAAFTGSLSQISTVNDWLGRSQFSVDPELTGTLHEFRIYNTALTPAQLNFSATQGPDPAYLPTE